MTESEEIELRIVEKALELFVAEGIKAVSMDDIAKAMTMSKRTLYLHFSSKDELLVRCIRYMDRKQKERIDAYLNSGASFIEIMLYNVRDTLTLLQRVSPIFLQDLVKMNCASAIDTLEHNMEDNRLRLKKHIEKGQEDGIIDSRLNADLVSHLIISKKAQPRIFGATQWNMSEIIVETSTIFMRGMATEKGRRMIDEFLEKQVQTEINKE